jgi:glycosyltransferase involved in cell wall biosynthesis
MENPQKREISMSLETTTLKPIFCSFVQGRVSIITAVYNAATTLVSCLESVMAQDYPNTEHILMDGASTDGSVEVLKRYDERILWRSEPDKGIYDAWNKALTLATGEWIAFLGADDILLPGAIQSYMDAAIQKPDAEYISSNVRLLYPSGATKVIGQPWSWPSFQNRMTTAHVASMHRRSLFQRYGQYDASYRIVGDYELLLRPGAGLKAHFIPVVTAEMRTGGASDSFSSLYEAERAKVMTGGRSRVLARSDLFIAKTKLYIRRKFPILQTVGKI